jgi:hypothetical protein
VAPRLPPVLMSHCGGDGSSHFLEPSPGIFERGKLADAKSTRDQRQTSLLETKVLMRSTPRGRREPGENRCAECGGKFGLICHRHWGLRFCRKACKDVFVEKLARDKERMRTWLGFLARDPAQ